MKKKILSILITILTACMLMFTLSACGGDGNGNGDNPPHIHNYGTLKYDNENHWFECECGDKTNETIHNIINGGCVCGYVVPHTHVYTTIKFDSESHWEECECGEKANIELHKGGIATETNKATCSVCNQEYGESLGHVHTLHLTKVDAKPQSCTEEGNIEYYTCSCGKWFTDNTATTEITDKTSVVIEKDAHKYEALKKTATEHWWECSCGAYETKENHIPGAEATETTDQKCTECDYIITPALGHVHTLHLTKVDAKPQSCTEEGNVEYYTCSCGKWFADNTATTEITDKSSVVIEKDAHEYETLKKTATEHWWECSCGAYETKENHKGGTATCQVKATCSVCDTVYGDFAEHEPKTAWITTDTHHYHECIYGCTEKLNYAEHSFTNYVSNKDATYEKDGTKTAKCDSGCGITHTVTDEGSMLTKDEIRFTTLNVNGKDVYGKVSNATTEFVFYEEIFVSGNATYVVDDDKSCSSPIDSKTVDLVVGDNTFYVLEMVGNNVKLYTVTIHRREMFTVTFNTNGGTAVDNQIVEEDSFATEPTTIKTGYTFDGWDYDFSKPITKNEVITASWTANKDTAYKVEYYLENLENEKYTLIETESLEGTTDTTAYAEIKEFNGFTPEESEVSANINGNGLTVLKVYYQCNEYTVSISNKGAGSITGAGKYKYGTKLTLTATEPNVGYIWLGWYNGDTRLSSSLEYSVNLDKDITANYTLLPEMTDFKFTSTTTNCRITGVKDKTVTEIVVPNYITSIDIGAFGDCEKLESITLQFVGEELNGSSNTHFGYIFGATSYSYNDTCVPTSLKTVIITGGSSIDEYAFFDCYKLTSIEIPSSITSIGNSAFYYCSSLTKVNYAGTIDEWVQIGFSDYHSNPICYGATLYVNNEPVTDLIIPNTVTEIKGYAFASSSFTSIEIPSSVTRIGHNAFYGCTSLTSIEIPNSVTSIGWYAFEGCTSLTSIKIPNSVTYIGSSAFGGCSKLESITLPFVGRSLDETFETHFGYIFGASYSYDHDSYVPTSLKTVVITGGLSIDHSAFYNCSSITSITIPNSVTSIDISAFYNCTSLTSVTMGNKLTYIGSSAFYNCSSLTSVEIPKSVTSIGNKVFYYCDSLTSIEIPDSVTSIGDYAFFNCCSLTSIEIPNSVTSIGSSAFSSCDSLTSVVIGDSVTSIGSSAFSRCTKLTSIEIPDSVTSIGDYAFSDCSSLTKVNYAGTIDEWAQIEFGGSYANPLCNGASLYISNVLVTEANITTATKINNYAFYDYDSLTSVIIGNNVTSIGKCAFSWCSSLESIEIPNSVTSIENNAFYRCDSLASVVIPDSVTNIGEYALASCSSLQSITYIGTVEEWDNVSKGSNWSSKIQATQVVCSDGTVNI